MSGLTCVAWELDNASRPIVISYAESESGAVRLLGTGGAGVWLSAFYGQEWEPINAQIAGSDQIRPFDIAMLDAEGDSILVTSNLLRRAYLSFNGGETWQTVVPPRQLQSAPELLIPASQDLPWIITHDDGVSRSFDNGNHWEHITFSYRSDKRGLFRNAVDESTVCLLDEYSFDSENATEYGGLSISVDNGSNWTQLTNDLFAEFNSDLIYFSGAISMTNGEYLLAVLTTFPENWTSGELLLSSNNGADWARVFDQLPENFAPYSLIEVPNSQGTILVGSLNGHGVYRSSDYGLTWRPVNFDFVHGYLDCDGLATNAWSGDVFAYLSGYGLYRSIDGGVTWLPYAMPDIGETTSMSQITGKSITVRGHSARLWERSINANQWQEHQFHISNDTLLNAPQLLARRSDTLIASVLRSPSALPDTPYSLHLLRSEGNGAEWIVSEALGFSTSRMAAHWQDSSSSIIVFPSNGGDSVFVSGDEGHSWRSHRFPLGFRATNLELNSLLCVAAGRQGESFVVYTSTDTGATWSSTGYQNELESFTPNFDLVENVLYIISMFQEPTSLVLRWQGGGLDTVGIIDDHSVQSLSGIQREGQHIIVAATGLGHTWLSTDSGASWGAVLSSFPFQGNFSGPFDIELVQSETDVIAWCTSSIGELTLNVTDALAPTNPKPNGAPKDLAISVFPNPTNCSVRISIELHSSKTLSIDIYDLLGRKVKPLLENMRQSGVFRTDFSFDTLPSGVYYLQVRTEVEQVSRKIINLK